jgi:hypothetical protein
MVLHVKRRVTNSQSKHGNPLSIAGLRWKSERGCPEYEEKVYIIDGAFWCRESTAGHVVRT